MKSYVKINIPDFLFYAVLAIFVFFTIIQTSLLPYAAPMANLVIYKLITVFRVSLVGIALFDNIKITTGKLILIAVCLITYIFTSYWAFFDLFFIGVFYKNKDYQKILKTIFFSILAAVIVVVGLYFLHFMPDYIVLRDDGRERISLGFSHPNTLGRIILLISVIYVLIRRDRMKLFEYAVMGIAAVFIYIYPNSITSAFLIILMISILLFKKIYTFLRKKEIIENRLIRRVCIIMLPLIVAALFIILAIFMKNSGFIADFPKTLQSRVIMGKKAIDIYGISLFGNDITFTSSLNIFMNKSNEEYFVVDNFYYYLLIKFGLIAFAYYLVMYFKRIIKSIKEKDVYRLMTCMIFMIYSISENSMLSSLSICLSFIFIDTDSKNMIINRLSMIPFKIRFKDGKI